MKNDCVLFFFFHHRKETRGIPLKISRPFIDLLLFFHNFFIFILYFVTELFFSLSSPPREMVQFYASNKIVYLLLYHCSFYLFFTSLYIFFRKLFFLSTYTKLIYFHDKCNTIFLIKQIVSQYECVCVCLYLHENFPIFIEL